MTEKPMTRRAFLKTSAWAGALFAATPFWASDLDESMPPDYFAPVPAYAPLEWSVPADLANTDPAILALNRMTFGPRPGDVDRVRAMGVDAFIEEQLAPESIDDARVDLMLQALPSLAMEIADLGKYYAVPFIRNKVRKGDKKQVASALSGIMDLIEQTDPNGMAKAGEMQMDEVRGRMQALVELIQATVLRHVYSERQLFEVMVDFWSNHFNINAMKDDCRYLKTWDDRTVIRKHALGKFRDLLFASARSPAMLVYLDNRSNVKGMPQENYAREVMELHTLGVESGFTQMDVQEVARAFTGWSVITANQTLSEMDYDRIGVFQFRKRFHDNGAKQVLGIPLPAGGGERDGERVLEILAAHPKTAEHISFKLVRRFVDDNPPPALVARAAQTFARTDGDIRAVLDTILHSDEFSGSFGKKLKRPLEFVASSLRVLNADLADVELKHVTLRGTNKQPGEPVASSLRTLGQVPFLWPSPNGYPDVSSAWVNSSNLVTRWNFTLSLTTNRLLEFQVALDSKSAALDPEELVNEWSDLVLSRALPEADRVKLVEFVRGDDSDTRLENLVALLISSPHFQYR